MVVGARPITIAISIWFAYSYRSILVFQMLRTYMALSGMAASSVTAILTPCQ